MELLALLKVTGVIVVALLAVSLIVGTIAVFLGEPHKPYGK